VTRSAVLALGEYLLSFWILTLLSFFSTSVYFLMPITRTRSDASEGSSTAGKRKQKRNAQRKRNAQKKRRVESDEEDNDGYEEELCHKAMDIENQINEKMDDNDDTDSEEDDEDVGTKRKRKSVAKELKNTKRSRKE
jgi:hypothetical protein